MAANPDPKPGRWILPLVILGMIGFTYFFVRELPQASPDTTLVGQPVTTTVPEGTVTTDAGTPGGPVDPETQAYLDELDAINDELQLQGVEMVTINDGFDADPREVAYEDAEVGLEAIVNDTQALSDTLDNLTVPEGMEVNQEALKTAMQFAALAAGDALNGLRSTDTGELRRNAVEAYTRAVSDFATEVTNAHNAASSSA